MKKIFLIFICFFVVLESSRAAEIPVLIVKTFDGKNFDLKEKRGKVVIINFWAQWCVDCRKEMLVLQEIYNEYKSRGLEMIGVSIDHKRSRDKVLQVAGSLNYPNAMLIDAEESSFDVPDSVPTNYVIDKNGKLAATLIGNAGEANKKNFTDVLDPLFLAK